ncbi:unnamed protein product [Eretmochelys imbricata]
MWVALPLCLLSALLATGSALQCEVCASREQSCSGPLQPCAPSEGTCVTVVAEIRLEGYYFSCCDTNGCNTRAIPVPTVSSVPNGQQSLTLFNVEPFHRQGSGMLACTGAEDHCVDESGRLTVGGITVMKIAAGCASPGAWRKRVGERKYVQCVGDWLIRAKCYPAPRAGGGIGEP